MRTVKLWLVTLGSACGFVPDSRLVDSVELDAAGLTALDLYTEAGDAQIFGEEDRALIEMEVTVTWSGPRTSEEAREALVTTLEVDGDHARAEAWVDSAAPRIGTSVVIRVPETLAIDVEDGSGELVVHRVASLVIADGSGDIRVSEVAGPVTVDDGSGELRIEDVAGEVDIRDDSGGVLLRNASSTSIVDESGDLGVEDIEGDVTIEDGSGDIVVRRVSGTVTVRDDSGDILAEDVGDLDVVRDGSGEVVRR